MPLSASLRVKRRLKAVVARITRNRPTLIFFLFGFFHCFAQGIVQSLQFTLDAQYSGFLSSIVDAAQLDPRAHADLQENQDHFQLKVCNDIPHNDNVCSTVFDSNKDINVTIGPDSNSGNRGFILEHMMFAHDVSFGQNSTNNSGVILRTPTDQIGLSETCVKTLLLPLQRTQNVRREDVAFVILQFWLFGIVMTAVIYDSAPHILAGLGTRVILTAWSAYALWRSSHYHYAYSNLIERPGTPCSAQLFTGYFETRAKFEVIDLILNCMALLVYICLSRVLLKLYNVGFSNRVGTPPKIIKINRYFMGVKVCLQLEAFVLLAATGLWTDQLFNTYIHDITDFFGLFEGVSIVWTIVLIPWIVTGWYGIRYEHRTATLVFTVAAFVFLTCSSVMFSSEVYRWTYYTWPNFACYATASLVLLLASFVLGILCRMNFGQGLSQYLHAEASASESPDSRKTLPTDSSPLPASAVSTTLSFPAPAIAEKVRSPFADPDDQDTESGLSTGATTNGVRSSTASTPELRDLVSPFTPVEELISEGSNEPSSPIPSINRSRASHSTQENPEPSPPSHPPPSYMSFPSVARTLTVSSSAPSYSSPRRYTAISDETYDTLPSYRTVQRIHAPAHFNDSKHPLPGLGSHD